MKKQTQKKRPAKGAKNTDRAAVILSLFRELISDGKEEKQNEGMFKT